MYEGLGTMSQALDGLGEKRAADVLRLRLDEIRSHGGNIGDHDHDGDGKQDH